MNTIASKIRRKFVSANMRLSNGFQYSRHLIILLITQLIYIFYLEGKILTSNSVCLNLSQKTDNHPKSKIIKKQYHAYRNNSYNIYPKLRPDNPKSLFRIKESNKNEFLLPMLHFQEGPNNLIRLFKETALVAHDHKQNLVIPYFHTHGRMSDDVLPLDNGNDDNSNNNNSHKKFKIPINMQDEYLVDIIDNPDDTVFTDLMARKMGILDHLNYDRICNKKIDMLVTCGRLIKIHDEGRKFYLQASGLEVENEVHIQTIEDYANVIYDARKNGLSEKEDKCFALLLGKECLTQEQLWLNLYGDIAPYIQRPAILTSLAADFHTDIMNGKPYLSMHWRFDDDWLQMCAIDQGPFSRRQNLAICHLITELAYNHERENTFKSKLSSLLNEYGLEQIYLATTPNNVKFLALIKKYFGDKIKTFEDLKNYVEDRTYEGYLDNSYYSSQIEQEMCLKSSFFLGSGLSSWTQTVLTDRISQGNYNHGSILARLGFDQPPAPGYPPLIFQFPEGGFRFQFPEDEETGLMYSNDDSIGGGDENLSALSTKLGRKSASKAKDVAFLKIFGVKNRILDQMLEKFAMRNGLSMGVLLESENDDDLQKRIKYQFNKEMISMPTLAENQQQKKIRILSAFLGYSSHLRSFTNMAMRYITLIANPVNMQKYFILKHRFQSPYLEILGNPVLTTDGKLSKDQIAAEIETLYSDERTTENLYKNYHHVPFSFYLKNPIKAQLYNELNLDSNQNINFRLDLVLIQEELEKSLLVLADRLSWSVSEITYLKNQIEQFYFSNNEFNGISFDSIEISSKVEKNIKKWHNLDSEIYKKMNSKLNQQFEELQGDKLASLQAFENRLEDFSEKCSDDHKIQNDPLCSQYSNYSPFDFENSSAKKIRELIPIKIRNPNNNIMSVRNNYNNFLQKGRWVEKDIFLPQSCIGSGSNLEWYSEQELNQKLKDKSILFIGDGRINLLQTIFEKLNIDKHTKNNKITKLFTHRYSEKLPQKIQSIGEHDYILIGEQWIWSNLNSENYEVFKDDIENGLKKMLQKVAQNHMADSEGSGKKILVLSTEPYLSKILPNGGHSEHITKIENSRDFFNNNIEKIFRDNEVYHRDINLMTTNVLNSYDFEDKFIHRTGKDKMDRKKLGQLKKFNDLPGNLQSDVYSIFRYFLEEPEKLC